MPPTGTGWGASSRLFTDDHSSSTGLGSARRPYATWDNALRVQDRRGGDRRPGPHRHGLQRDLGGPLRRLVSSTLRVVRGLPRRRLLVPCGRDAQAVRASARCAPRRLGPRGRKRGRLDLLLRTEVALAQQSPFGMSKAPAVCVVACLARLTPRLNDWGPHGARRGQAPTTRLVMGAWPRWAVRVTTPNVKANRP
jgi:hypothetical protein